jgi:hypothetical protein
MIKNMEGLSFTLLIMALILKCLRKSRGFHTDLFP